MVTAFSKDSNLGEIPARYSLHPSIYFLILGSNFVSHFKSLSHSLISLVDVFPDLLRFFKSSFAFDFSI